jgi:predicted ester cyclase
MDVADPSEKTRFGKEQKAAVSAEENNMALVRRFLEARTHGDLDAMDEIMAPNFIDYTLAPGRQPDREGYKRQVAKSVSAFSDIHFVIEEQEAAGDKVVSCISGHGTHDRSELMGTAPTGREMASMAIFIHRILPEGKSVEQWGTGPSELLGHRLEQEWRERERIGQELLVARRIQQASLPKEIPETHLQSLWVRVDQKGYDLRWIVHTSPSGR